MASMRRRLRGITTRVSAPKPADLPSPEAPEEPVVEEHVEEPVPDTGEVTLDTTLPTTVDTLAPVDPVLAAAVDLARAVAVEAGGTSVGDHLGVEADEELVATHSFATTDPAYVGWRWTVTVARSEGLDEVTVDEVVLLPGSGALVAPVWVPYSERVEAGDLSPGDLLPPAPDDERIVPAYADDEAELAAETFWELGLGRPRVMSFEGRAQTADRWYDGERGPFTPMAKQAPATCLSCAFRLPLAGGLRSLFGVCANAQSPDDAHVVSLDHGCGAHSETPVTLTHSAGASGMVVEDEELEVVPSGPSPDDETPDGHAS